MRRACFRPVRPHVFRPTDRPCRRGFILWHVPGTRGRAGGARCAEPDSFPVPAMCGNLILVPNPGPPAFFFPEADDEEAVEVFEEACLSTPGLVEEEASGSGSGYSTKHSGV